jgi:putative MFS transporter
VKTRGKFMSLDVLFYPVGALAAILIGYWLLGVGLNAWRYMLAMAIIPALIIIVARLGTPESPRWLLERNRTDDAITVIENVIERPLTDEEKTLIKTMKSPERQRNTYYRELLTKFSKNAAFIAIFYIAYQIAFVATGVLSSLFAISLSLPVETASALFWIENIIAILIIAFTIDRFGRKPLSNVGWIGVILAFLALIFVPSNVGKLILLVIYSLLALFLNFQGGLHFTFSAELAPTRIRGTMEGWKQGVARFTAAAFSTVVIPLIGFHKSLYVMMAIAIVALIANIVMLPETKGKSLEQLWK